MSWVWAAAYPLALGALWTAGVFAIDPGKDATQ